MGSTFLFEVIMWTYIMSSMDMVCPRHDSACIIHVQLYFVYYVSQFNYIASLQQKTSYDSFHSHLNCNESILLFL